MTTDLTNAPKMATTIRKRRAASREGRPTVPAVSPVSPIPPVRLARRDRRSMRILKDIPRSDGVIRGVWPAGEVFVHRLASLNHDFDVGSPVVQSDGKVLLRLKDGSHVSAAPASAGPAGVVE
jgi:hypothetical protein